jgi:hypothetical protein
MSSYKLKDNLLFLTFNEVFFNASAIAMRKRIFVTDDDKFFFIN